MPNKLTMPVAPLLCTFSFLFPVCCVQLHHTTSKISDRVIMFALDFIILVTYHFFHWKKGTPFGDDQGIYNGLTWWEQIDNGKQLTRNRKFLTVVPVVLYLIASHTTDYQHPMLFFNTLAVLVLVIAKFPNMHKVRIFGINGDQ
ncbi:ORM1-like protein 1 isoform X2 [Sesamum indicum]|uniref:ORM1-like protein 1 isoform X2 n=1 Tax=Sesamum indicum TaxID=4182 RepID=A0A8M8VAJ9_SESIN|nr:ORM1-like protein 1 isoform X2 [Sesamum indicum]